MRSPHHGLAGLLLALASLAPLFARAQTLSPETFAQLDSQCTRGNGESLKLEEGKRTSIRDSLLLKEDSPKPSGEKKPGGRKPAPAAPRSP